MAAASLPGTMKSIILPLLAFLAVSVGLSGLAAEAAKPRLRHVVSFKFKETASKSEIEAVEKAFAGLKSKIPQIRGFEWGLNNSPEGLNKGCTHGFILTFDSEADRDAYLVHPDHKVFGALVGPVLADVFVIDFWARD